MIVEASPLDRIWGVGFGEKRALSVKQSWGVEFVGEGIDGCEEDIERGGTKGTGGGGGGDEDG